MENKKKSLNWPLIIISGFGIFAFFFLTFIFVQGLAINTVKESILIQKAYPKVKPQEYINELKIKASENKITIREISSNDRAFIIQIIKKELMEKLLNESPDVAIASVINLSIYDVGDGTAIVANNPYIWDMISPSSYLDDIVQSYSEEISLILDSIYWDIKKKKEILK